MTTTARRFDVDRRGRFYTTPDGEAYPSVTNILGCVGKPALVNWAANQERTMVIQAAANLYEDAPATPKMHRAAYIETLQRRLGLVKAHQKELAKAAEIGTEAHALIEWNLRQELGQRTTEQPRVSDKAAWAFMAYEDWRKTIGLKPVMIEQTIWSKTHGYAGTMDLCADVKEYDSLAVIDFKTGKAIYPEALLQIAAYTHALIEMGHAPTTNVYGIVLRLPKIETDPAFEVRIIKPEEQDALFRSFLAVFELWKFIQANDKWMKAEAS